MNSAPHTHHTQESAASASQPRERTADTTLARFAALYRDVVMGRRYRTPPAHITDAAPTPLDPRRRAPDAPDPAPSTPAPAAPTTPAPTTPDLSERKARLEKIAAEIRICQRCPLHSGRQHAVPGTGVLNPLVMAIGEAPGANEDAQGEPFVGRAGQYLDKWLHAIGVSRLTNAFIANIVKCRPPHNRDPERNEVAQCRPFIDRQIACIEPHAILILGRIAAQHLFDTKDSLALLRTQHHHYQHIPVFITYHPSAVLRNPALRRAVWDDLQRLQRHITQG